jgi:DHA2 family multidrug resistance protein-like MFS transporter
MDATILNVALPSLAADLEPGSTELLWIVDVYGLVLAGLLVAMGGLGDRIGRRRLLLVGLGVFFAASAAIAFAASPAQLIAGRAALGVGGAMIMPSTLSVLRNVFTVERERTIAIGVWSAVASAGFALGPIVGGALLEVAPWGWVFAINLPIVLVAAALVVRWVPESRNPDPGPWDSVSVALSVAGMLALVWGVKHGGEDGFAEPATIAALTVGAAALAAFVRRQARSRTPLVDVWLFADRRFATAAAAVLFVFFGLAALLLLLTQHLQLVQGHGPLAAGLRLLPLAVAAGVVSPLTDVGVRRAGPHVVVGGGFALIAAGLALLTGLDAGTPYGLIALALALVGAGAGLAATAGSAAIMASAPAERAGGAAAVQETAFELGGALGVAVLGSLLAARYRDGLDAQGPGAEAAREGLPAAVEAAARVGGDGGAALLAAAQEAFTSGIGATFTVAALVTAVVALAAALGLPRRASVAVDG